jgi:hypothetical protein
MRSQVLYRAAQVLHSTIVHSNTTFAAAAVTRPMLVAIAVLLKRLEPAQHGKQPSLKRRGHEVSSTQKPHADRSHRVQHIHFTVQFMQL